MKKTVLKMEKSVEKELYDCLEKVDLLDQVNKYPKKLKEEIGSFSQSGNDLSGASGKKWPWQGPYIKMGRR